MWWNTLSVEPTMFFYMFAFMLTTVYEQDFFLQRACLVNHKLSPVICSNLSHYPKHQTAVQSTTSLFFLYEDVLAQLFPTILAIFVGAWSDKFGRKWPLVIALSGKLYYSLVIALNASFNWHLEYVLLTATMPTSLSGSDIVIFASCFSYISDITNIYNRTLRISILDASFLCAMPLGIYLGRYLFVNVVGRSYAKLFLINSFFMMLSIVYTLVKVKNNTAPYPFASTCLSKCQKLLMLFDYQSLVVTYKVLCNSDYRRNPNVVCDDEVLDVQRLRCNMEHTSSRFDDSIQSTQTNSPVEIISNMQTTFSYSNDQLQGPTDAVLSSGSKSSHIYMTPNLSSSNLNANCTNLSISSEHKTVSTSSEQKTVSTSSEQKTVSTSSQKTVDSQFEEIFGELNESIRALEEMSPLMPRSITTKTLSSIDSLHNTVPLPMPIIERKKCKCDQCKAVDDGLLSLIESPSQTSLRQSSQTSLRQSSQTSLRQSSQTSSPPSPHSLPPIPPQPIFDELRPVINERPIDAELGVVSHSDIVLMTSNGTPPGRSVSALPSYETLFYNNQYTNRSTKKSQIIPTVVTSVHYEKTKTKQPFPVLEEVTRPRYVISLIVLAMFFYAFAREEKQSLNLYTRKTFHWQTEQYSYFSLFRSLSIAGTLMILLPCLTRIVRISDFLVSFIGCAIQIAAYSIFYWTTNSYYFLQAGILSGMGVMVAPVIRSIASKLIHSTHRGMLFGLLSICENASPLISSVVYSNVYRQTMNQPHNAIFLVSIASQMAVALLLLCIYIINGYRDAAGSQFNMRDIPNVSIDAPNNSSHIASVCTINGCNNDLTPEDGANRYEMQELSGEIPEFQSQNNRSNSVVSLIAQLKATQAGRRGGVDYDAKLEKCLLQHGSLPVY